MQNTSEQYDSVINLCRQLFEKKMKDYGPAWRILRLPSLTDQIFIKAQRLRSIEMKGTQLVEDDQPDMTADEAMSAYDKFARESKSLMEKKNHDYGEAWRDMRISSFTDLILQKLLRIKQIEDNKGKTLVSEGIDANYFDMVNYSVFALIQMGENS